MKKSTFDLPRLSGDWAKDQPLLSQALKAIIQDIYLNGAGVAAPALAWSTSAPYSNMTVPAAYSVYISGGYEVQPGYTLDISAGAFVEIG